MKKTTGSLPYFHDLSQENLFLKAELARSHQLIHELEASYFHQKNHKLSQENAALKQQLQQLSIELERISANKEDESAETLNRIKSELLGKIVVLQELLQKETYARKQEIEEKHRLHLTNVKAEEEKKSLHSQIEYEKLHAEKEKTLREKKEHELENAAHENARLKDELHAKGLQLKQIETDVAVLKERVTETKNRLLEAEKTKEALFYETILSYKRQLDESDKWIASHFADIDTSQQTEKALEQNEELFERSEQIEAVLQTVTEQVDQLQQQLSVIKQNDMKMDQKITEWKKQTKEETTPQKWVYQIKRKDKETKPLN
ncbi:sporulation protein [Bacillus paralicheniformis]|jgi:sigma-E controlled sporulation protein|uniref:Sporulation protein cse15 n=1 Tax=Bacillus paralicheniformis TaxID=1648923 RepID=A0ABY3FPS9_9BACI|nr:MULTISPECIES: sporulation protein YknT [Bacillus]KJD53214.1 sporulation protein [Bacillus amyloliquefaciens]KUL14428.1 sporulation protein [Bacillus licheniformis LMG 7559]KUL18418.1 sporulation protein [Bacillus licheniformis LMG 6934]AGN36041.1 putative sporulation protein YknT [Bacillus paralicheniformis ATCC 9945a]AJO17878.1 sigma-E controlled sporulation protein [Bacillus paralicheniformis]